MENHENYAELLTVALSREEKPRLAWVVYVAHTKVFRIIVFPCCTKYQCAPAETITRFSLTYLSFISSSAHSRSSFGRSRRVRFYFLPF